MDRGAQEKRARAIGVKDRSAMKAEGHEGLSLQEMQDFLDIQAETLAEKFLHEATPKQQQRLR